MVKIETDIVQSYLLFENKNFTLNGEFTKWSEGEVQEIIFTLSDAENGDRSYTIEDVFFCKKFNRLEIHIFKNSGSSTESKFTANNNNLMKMTLNSKEKRDLDFIDYFKDSNPEIERCFVPKKIRTDAGIHPEKKKGNVIIGNP